MNRKLVVYIYTPQELNHSSYIQTGLFELEKQGFLKCKIVLSTKPHRGRISVIDEKVETSNHAQPKTSFYKLIDLEHNRSITFAADLYDISYYFSEIALKNCDFIFKRNYEKTYIDRLPENFKSKIYSLGLTFGLQSEQRHGDLKLLFGLLISNLRLDLKFEKDLYSKFIKILKKNYSHYKFTKSARTLKDFLELSSESENIALFQTRCFPNEDISDVKNIHTQRVKLIQELRKNLGDKFVGGLVPCEISKNKYKETLTDMPTDQQSYLKLVKQAKIGIYTRGLANSPAWKMAEYLSQGKAIVAEKLTTELPVELKDGQELLYFRNENECAELTKQLLNNPNLMNHLSKNARTYFMQYIHPSENIKRIINLMLSKK